MDGDALACTEAAPPSSPHRVNTQSCRGERSASRARGAETRLPPQACRRSQTHVLDHQLCRQLVTERTSQGGSKSAAVEEPWRRSRTSGDRCNDTQAKTDSMRGSRTQDRRGPDTARSFAERAVLLLEVVHCRHLQLARDTFAERKATDRRKSSEDR